MNNLGLVRDDIYHILENLGDRRGISEIVDSIHDEVCEDIKECADENFSEDDTRMAIRRLMQKRLVKSTKYVLLTSFFDMNDYDDGINIIGVYDTEEQAEEALRNKAFDYMEEFFSYDESADVGDELQQDFERHLRSDGAWMHFSELNECQFMLQIQELNF